MCFRPAEASLNDHNICEACGAENAPGETLCANCGEQLIKKTILDAPTKTNVAAPPPIPEMASFSNPPIPTRTRPRP